MPEDWSRIEKWIYYDVMQVPDSCDTGKWTKKNLEVPRLESYTKNPHETFWKSFPNCELPEKVMTNVNFSALEKQVFKTSRKLTKAQIKRASRCVHNLKVGASSCQKSPPLPAVYAKNAKSAFLYGEEVTDSIATFVKKVLYPDHSNLPLYQNLGLTLSWLSRRVRNADQYLMFRSLLVGLLTIMLICQN